MGAAQQLQASSMDQSSPSAAKRSQVCFMRYRPFYVLKQSCGDQSSMFRLGMCQSQCPVSKGSFQTCALRPSYRLLSLHPYEGNSY